MFVPLKDDNPLKVIPFEFVNTSLIAVCVFVFVVFESGLVLTPDTGQYAFALTPVVYFNDLELPDYFVHVPTELTLVTYIFMHGSWMHLLSNMAFLWVFGDNIEDAMGHVTYLVFFVLCGVVAGLAHGLVQPDSHTPLIGASGAIAGVVGAYLILHPRVKLWLLLLWRIPLYVPAYLAIGAWIALQFVNAAMATADDETAWWAHIGGFAAGLALTPLLRRRGVPLFDQGVRH